MGILDSKLDLSLDADKMVSDITGSLDQSTKRLSIDMASSNWLSQSIRPMITIWAAIMYTILSIMSLWLAYKTNEFGTALMSIFASIATILITIIGFYFKSRRQEKIDIKKTQAALEIKKMELESKIELEEMQQDSDLDDEKLERKIKNRESRRKGKFKLFHG